MKDSQAFLYLEIAESLRRRIASGELKPGDRLPPVREMAKRWGCTPGTVIRAYAQLTQEGLAMGRRGGGTRVASSTLQPEHAAYQWAALVNQAEQFLLEAISKGHSPAQIQSALSVAVARWEELRRPGSSTTRPGPAAGELRFAGSHDLAVERLAQMLGEESPGVQLSIQYVGSLGGLIALARGEAEVAGVHLWDEVTDTYNVPFVQRLLPGRQTVLLTLAHRSLGLIVLPGNPQGIHSLIDLSKPDVRWVNRQSGSGTRVWFDAQCKALGIAPESIAGHEREELTHLAVARAVREGEATAGLGIYAAAIAYGLGFVPLAQERYDLAVPETVWNSPPGHALCELVNSSRFKEAVTALGGYDTVETGRETKVS